MIVFPNAKINIGLRVVARRKDGYHDIESVFYPTGWCDVLEGVSSEEGRGGIEFTQTGIPLGDDTGSNLCVRACRLLAGRYDLPSVRMHLHKLIPPGSGLGGGSSDAMHTLLLLNRMFDIGLNTEALRSAGAELGSDVPFFAMNGPVLVTGRGDRLQPIGLGLAGYHLVVVFPGIPVSTKSAYALVDVGKHETSLSELLKRPPDQWKGNVENVFERALFPKHPQLAVIKQKLYESGAVYASMTGSGSAIYGIFESHPDIRKLFPGCLIHTEQLSAYAAAATLW